MDTYTSITILLVVLAALGFNSIFQVAASCPGSFTTTGCYVIGETNKDWFSARTDCEELATKLGYPGNGTLASLSSKLESDDVNQLLLEYVQAQTSLQTQNTLWIGASEDAATVQKPLWAWLSDEKHPVQKQNCFIDNHEKREFQVHQVFSALTPELCIDYCYMRGYRVAATRQGDTCSCGTLNSYGKYGTSEHCITPCSSGVAKELTCGGTDLNQVYIINGAYCDWTYNQPNNYDMYQTCGITEQLSGSGEYTIGDKLCREKLDYICQIPKSYCDEGKKEYTYLASDLTTCLLYTVNKRRNWFEAREECLNLNGDLVSINSSEIMADINKHLLYELKGTFDLFDSIWVGLVGVQWKWENKADFIFSKFSASHPSRKEFNCLQLVAIQSTQLHIQWEDNDCSIKQPYICHIDMEYTLPTTTTSNTTTTPTNSIATTTTTTITTTTTTTEKPREPASTSTKTETSISTSQETDTTTSAATTSMVTNEITDLATSTSSPVTYILLVIIAVVVIFINILCIVFWFVKKTQSEELFRPEKEDEESYNNGNETDKETIIGIDNESMVTASNVQTDIAMMPDVMPISKLHEANFKLEPLVALNGHTLADLKQGMNQGDSQELTKSKKGDKLKKKSKKKKKKKAIKELPDLKKVPHTCNAVVVPFDDQDNLY